MDRRTFLAGTAGAVAASAIAPNAARADELPLGPLPGTRYPDPRIEALDPRFKYKIGNAYIERIATGCRWAEGPVYVPRRRLSSVERHPQQPHHALERR